MQKARKGLFFSGQLGQDFWMFKILLCLWLALANGHADRDGSNPVSAAGKLFANENVCAVKLRKPRPNFLMAEDGVKIWSGGRGDLLQALSDELRHRQTIAGPLSAGTLEVFRRARDLLHTPPFLLVVGDQLVRILKDHGKPSHYLELRTIGGADPERVFRLDPTSSLMPYKGSPDGRFLLFSDANQLHFDLVNLQTGSLVLHVPSNWQTSDLNNFHLRSEATFTGDGAFLTVTQPERVYLYDLRSQPPRCWLSQALKLTAPEPSASAEPPVGHRGALYFLPPENRFLAFYHGRSPKILDFGRKRVTEVRLPWNGFRLGHGIVDSSGQFGFVPHDARGIDVFRTEDGRAMRHLAVPKMVLNLAISPSGRYLAYAARGDEGFGVFDLSRKLGKSKTDKPLYEIKIPAGRGTLLQFNGEHELICGDVDTQDVYAFTLP